MEPMIRRRFPEDQKMLHYDPVDWVPTFQGLYNRQNEDITIVLRNRESGGLEQIEFHIVGATESPITTVKWIWGEMRLDEDQDYCTITFDYFEGRLVDIVAAPSPKPLPFDAMAKLVSKASYPAEVTSLFDISNREGMEDEE